MLNSYNDFFIFILFHFLLNVIGEEFKMNFLDYLFHWNYNFNFE